MLLFVALKLEVPTLHDKNNVFFTGVGKINATHVVTRELMNYKHTHGKLPSLVVNYGTAGSISDASGLVECKDFVQRDMDCSAIDVPKYHTPYEYLPDLSTNSGDVVCGTGDSFVTNKDELVKDMHIVDMEAYAIAKVCKKMLVPFVCFKYISDNAESMVRWAITKKELPLPATTILTMPARSGMLWLKTAGLVKMIAPSEC